MNGQASDESVREAIGALIAARDAAVDPARRALVALEDVTDDRVAALSMRSKAELLGVMDDVVVRAESIRVAIVFTSDREVPS